jgi:hypothetical protein
VIRKKQVAGQIQKMTTVEAVVIRCGCSDAEKRRADHHSKFNVICPKPRSREDLGVVSYHHRNPLKRLRYWVLKTFRRGPVNFGEVK